MAYRMALDIGATRTMIALMEEDAPEVVSWQRPYTDVVFGTHDSPEESMARAINRFLYDHNIQPERITGVGIGVPGTVERAAGRVITCPNLHVLDGTELGPTVKDHLGIPAYVDNNTNLIALGECTAGIGQGVKEMAVVFVGSGVGCGLILNGELYEGAKGVASEFGHSSVVPFGRECTCGAHGCLEMYCSGKGLTVTAEEVFEPRELFDLGTRFMGARLLIDQARNNAHDGARTALTQSFTYLGVSLRSLINILNPEPIVLGGGIVFAWPEGVDIVRDVVRREALPRAQEGLRIEISTLRNFAGVTGGAELVRREGRVGLQAAA